MTRKLHNTEIHEGILSINDGKLLVVNADDQGWTRNSYVLWFGAYGTTRVLVYANCLGDALDYATDNYLRDHAPGLLSTEQVCEEYDRVYAATGDNETACEESTVDMTPAGGYGDYIASWEWGIVAENPTRDDLLSIVEGK